MTGATGPIGAAATVEPCLVEDANSGRFLGNLQAAVNAAGQGDTLNVQGTCEGDTTIRKSLTIQGQGPGATLNGEKQSGSVLKIEYYGLVVSVTGLTITGGNAKAGGGIYEEGGTLTVADSTVTGNTASYGGGGIYIEYGTLTLTNSTVSDNAGGGICNEEGALTLTNSTISGNSASLGGGIEGEAVITNSTISGNTASDWGGGIFAFGGLSITNSVVTGNEAYYGGGIFGGSFTLVTSTVSGNRAAVNGGGIWIAFQGAPTFKGSRITGNTAGGHGGGIFLQGSQGGYSVRPPTFESESQEVSGNTPDNLYAEP